MKRDKEYKKKRPKKAVVMRELKKEGGRKLRGK